MQRQLMGWPALLALGLLALPLTGCKNSNEKGPIDSSARNSASNVGQSGADIFSILWELPSSRVSVSRMGDDGKPLDSNARVIVQEQGKGGDCLDNDNAPMPLLVQVDESLFEEPTFKTLIALLDNYVAAELKPEVGIDESGHQHWKEVDQFLDAVFESETMQVAVKHIRAELAPGISIQEIRDDVKRMWFEPYTNHYREAHPFCVGFEHVFVGEDESEPGNAPKCQDRVAGYHSWVKYYLDQKAGKVDYLGYDYPEGDVQDALDDPTIATIVMRWSPTTEQDGSYGNDLLKKPGGFFIGTRPELEIAFGTLAMYAQRADKYDNIDGKVHYHRVRLGENLFDLVMHPQSLPPTAQGASLAGDHIRTLYPKFRGRSIPDEQVAVTSKSGSRPTRASSSGIPTQPHNNGQIQIVRALVNPPGSDDEGEWVELLNRTSETIFDLAGWSLADQLGRKIALDGDLGVGEVVRVELNRDSPDSMMLKNGKGWIMLFKGDERMAGVRYSDPKSGEVIEFSD